MPDIRGFTEKITESAGSVVCKLSAIFKDKNQSPLCAKTAGEKLFDGVLRFVFFVLLAVALYFVAFTNKPPNFTGDAYGYWLSSYHFVPEGGEFDFANFTSFARGYSISFMVFIFIKVGAFFGFEDPVCAYYFCNSIFVSAILVYLAPYVFNRIFKKKYNYFSVLFFSVFFVAFWGGDLAHPLTDIPAICFIFISLAGYLKLDDGRLGLFAAFFCGAGAALAYNLRQSYLIFFYAMLALTALKLLFTREKHSFFGITRGFFGFLTEKAEKMHIAVRITVNGLRKAIKLSALLLGVVLVMLPQVAINHKHLNLPSWEVQTQYYSIAAENKNYPLLLFNAHGLSTMQKVDFYVKDFPTHEIYAAIYPNTPHAEYQKLFSYGDYFSDVLKHPDWYLKSWINGAFLGMSATYNTSYVTDLVSGFFARLFTGHLLLSVFVVTVFYCIYKYFVTKNKRERAKHGFFCLAPTLAIILSGAVSCLTKMESRYLLPWYIIVYGVIAFYCLADFDLTLDSIKTHCKRALKFAIPVIIVFILFEVWYFSLFGDNTLLVTALTEHYQWLKELL
ncbi:MAG: hypothetical protein IKA51_00090 [Clostridia bacterium]|nr:hypothetical protein [Clostridia bacterium]